MDPSKPVRNVGFSAPQRAAIRAVEEEALLDLVQETLNRLNRIGDRLDVFVTEQDKAPPRGEST